MNRESLMVGRPINHERRAELLDAAVEYAAEYGFAELSWRPVAAALGVSPTTLVHHFGTKEQMLEAILGRLRERVFVDTRGPAGQRRDLATEARASWTRAFDPSREAEYRLFFAVYGRALQAPQQFADFLDHVIAYWMQALIEVQGPDVDSTAASRKATLVIAAIRGLLLDLLATGDRVRIHETAEIFLASLEPPTTAVLPPRA
jgi:AcrR family transcriptional regulator